MPSVPVTGDWCVTFKQQARCHGYRDAKESHVHLQVLLLSHWQTHTHTHIIYCASVHHASQGELWLQVNGSCLTLTTRIKVVVGYRGPRRGHTGY